MKGSGETKESPPTIISGTLKISRTVLCRGQVTTILSSQTSTSISNQCNNSFSAHLVPGLTRSQWRRKIYIIQRSVLEATRILMITRSKEPCSRRRSWHNKLSRHFISRGISSLTRHLFQQCSWSKRRQVSIKTSVLARMQQACKNQSMVKRRRHRLSNPLVRLR